MEKFGRKLSEIAALKPAQPTATPPSDLHITPPEVVALMAHEGEPIRTGWPPLDRQFRRSGIPPGRVIVFGGAPFAGKTTIVCQIAWHMSQAVPVFALFADEGRTQAAIRFGVLSGVPLQEIEASPAEAAEKMRELHGERSLLLMKPDTEESTIAGLVKKARETVTPGDPAIIVVDSIQTIPLGLENDDEPNPRLAAKNAMKQIRKWAAELGFIFVLTSQSNRASYRNKKSEENSVAMSSFAESGSIEYMSDVAIVLGIPNDAGIVRVDFVKNRLKGTMGAFSIRYDDTTGAMLEIDSPSQDDAAIRRKQASDEKQILELQETIIPKLQKLARGSQGASLRKEGLSYRQILELVGGRYAVVRKAMDGLINQNAIIEEPGPRKSIRYRLKAWTEN